MYSLQTSKSKPLKLRGNEIKGKQIWEFCFEMFERYDELWKRVVFDYMKSCLRITGLVQPLKTGSIYSLKTLLFYSIHTSVWKICSTKHLISPSRDQLIHTKLDFKINFAFMYAVYYQGYSKRKALSQMRLCVFESLSLYVGVYVRLYMFEIVP